VHTSSVHGNPSSGQAVPTGLKASGGQSGLVPVQVSATSQSPEAERHSVPDGAYPSGGQSGLVPVHDSSTSHGPFDERQGVPKGRSVPALHFPSVQPPPFSHSPAEGHVWVAVAAQLPDPSHRQS